MFTIKLHPFLSPASFQKSYFYLSFGKNIAGIIIVYELFFYWNKQAFTGWLILASGDKQLI